MVESDGLPVYVRCTTCGRFVPTEELYARHYCSRECSVQYARCTVCGRYVAQPSDGEITYCSSACAAVYEVPINPTLREFLKEAS